MIMGMGSRRVVVTGLGIVSPAGCSVNEFWTTILSGLSCVTSLSFDDYPKIPSKVAAVVCDTNIEQLETSLKFDRGKKKYWSRSTLFASLAAHQAVTDAGLCNVDSTTKNGIGVVIGSGMSDFSDIYTMKEKLDGSYNKVSPYFIPRILLNMGAGNVSMEHGFRGPNHCASTACATGVHAIGDSFTLIRSGKAKAVVCGGTEACINPLTIAGFSRLRALSCDFNETPEEASRPFDEARDGFVIGEGAAIMVLEDLQHALDRKANTIYAEVCGYGMSGDACTLTTPSLDGSGAILAMKRCLSEANEYSIQNNISYPITKDCISYVNAHATSTPIGDQVELNAIAQLLGDRQSSSHPFIHVSSLKGCVGHLLGASGATELLGTILSCYHGWIPPTANLQNSCVPERHSNRETNNINEVPNAPSIVCNKRKVEWRNSNGSSKRVALKNAFGFGGTNACICISEFRL